jgi:hypothetical protein
MPEQDFYVLLAVAFDSEVDEISRAMFSERLEEFGWEPAGVPNTWKLMFDARTHSAADSVNSHLKLACERGRFEREQVKAVIHTGNDEPIQL